MPTWSDVMFYEQPTANAGPDIDECGVLSTSLAPTPIHYLGAPNLNYRHKAMELCERSR